MLNETFSVIFKHRATTVFPAICGTLAVFNVTCPRRLLAHFLVFSKALDFTFSNETLDSILDFVLGAATCVSCLSLFTMRGDNDKLPFAFKEISFVNRTLRSLILVLLGVLRQGQRGERVRVPQKRRVRVLQKIRDSS